MSHMPGAFMAFGHSLRRPALYEDDYESFSSGDDNEWSVVLVRTESGAVLLKTGVCFRPGGERAWIAEKEGGRGEADRCCEAQEFVCVHHHKREWEAVHVPSL
jgi:hypothetical protein